MTQPRCFQFMACALSALMLSAATAFPFTPPSGGNLQLWLSGDAGVTETDGLVSLWEDQSGNNNHAVQDDPDLQPEFREDAMNGLPVVHFDNDFMLTQSDVMNTDNHTIFMVIELTSYPGHQDFLGSNGIGDGHILIQSDVNDKFKGHFWSDSSANDIIGATDNVLEPVIYYQKVDESEIVIEKNGEVDGSRALAGTKTGSTHPISIGSRDAGFGDKLVGNVAEILVYDIALSVSDRRAVGQYLDEKYGIDTGMAFLPSPIIGELDPGSGSSYADAGEGFRFSITSEESTIAEDAVELIVNGVDRSADLTVSGDPANRSVHFDDLQTNRFYSFQITALDAEGLIGNASANFDTMDPEGNFTWEANDWNFGGGQFHDNPGIDWNDDPNYFDLFGTEGVDEHTISEAGNDSYRLGSPVGTEPADDDPREPFASDDRPDAVQYNVGWVAVGEWLNYTRTFPAGEYYVYGRLARDGNVFFAAQLDRVTSDRTQADQTTEKLGTFSANGTGGWQNYRSLPLLDDDGNLATVSLSGVETLRVTAMAGGYNANYYMLIPADTQPPRITGMQPGMGDLADARDGLSFNIESERGVAGGDIRLVLNGEDRTGDFTITGDENAWAVSFNNLEGGQSYTLEVDVIDADGVSHRLLAGGPLQVSFETAVAIPAQFATPVGSGLERGFTVQVHNARDDADTGAHFPNNTARTEAQLAGEIIDPETGEPFENLAIGQPGDQGGGVFIETGTINYDQTASAAGFFPDVSAYPGIVPEGDPNNFAIAAMGYLELDAGLHRFGVRSDDGFRLTVGPSFDESPLEVGIFSGGRGAGEGPGAGGTSEFEFLVDEAGVYAFRLLQYEGLGGASVEFYSMNVDSGERTLINDPNGIAAFQNREGEPDIPEPVDGVPAPTIVWDGNNHVISWEGTGFTLESADEITGPWQAVDADGTTHTETDEVEKRFYRLRAQ